MNSKYTRFFAVFAVALMVMSAAIPLLVCDDSNAELPSKYTIDSKYITDVRNQGNEGVCWSFGTAAALETEMILNGLSTRDQHMSPLFLERQQFDGYEKDYKGGDYNALYEYGTLNTIGGFGNDILALLSNWKSPVEEYLAPYEEFFVDYYSVSRSLDALALVKGTIALDPIKEAQQIKKMLNQNHGAVFSYSASNRASDPIDGRITFYTPYNEGNSSNHAVELIGYDDNYPKERFTNSAGTPSNNGAWLIKNSWGKGTGVGDGYAWVSYECVVRYVMFITVIEDNDGSQNLYSYDHGFSTKSDLYRSGSATMCNIFTSERNETLTGVSMTQLIQGWNIHSLPLDQSYVVKVYKLGAGYKDPTDGKLVYTSKSGVANHVGTTYIKFDKPVSLSKGDKFSVCIELTGSKICLPVDTTDYNSTYVCHTVAEAGQSLYLSDNGNWTDLSADGKSNFRIKAYTESVPTGNVASITNTSGVTYYKSLQDAIDHVQKDDVVKLLCSVELDKTLEIKGTPFFVMNLNGFTVSVAGVDVVSVKDCTVWITEGKFRSSDGEGSAIVTDNAKVDLSRVYLDSVDNSITAKNASDVKLHYCTVNNEKNAFVYEVYGESTKVLVEKQYLTKPDNKEYTLCDLEYAHTLILNEGDFYGEIVDVMPMFVAGNAQCGAKLSPTDIARGSSKYEQEGGIITIGVNFIEYVSDGETGRTFSFELALKRMDPDTTLKLIDDVFLWKPIKLNDASKPKVTIDLNGHNITMAGNLFELYSEVTLTNSSSTRSTIDCASIGYIGKIHVEANIDISAFRYVAYNIAASDIVVDISGLSSVYRLNDEGIAKEITIPYCKDGKYCEKVITKIYAEDGFTVTQTTVEERTYLSLHQQGSKIYTSTSVTTFPDGSEETSVRDGLGLTKTIRKDGTITMSGSSQTSTGGTFTIDLVQNEVGTIMVSFTADYGQEITVDNISKLKDSFNTLMENEEIKSVGCSGYKLVAFMKSTSGYEHTFDQSAVEYLAENHINLTIVYSENTIEVPYQVLEDIHGDLTLGLSPLGNTPVSKTKTDVIDDTKLAYTAVMKVDGKYPSGELSEQVTIKLALAAPNKDMKAYTIMNDGKFMQLESKLKSSGNSDTIVISTKILGTFVICDHLDDDDEEYKPTDSGSIDGVLIAAIVIAAIVGCAFGYLIFRPRH